MLIKPKQFDEFDHSEVAEEHFASAAISEIASTGVESNQQSVAIAILG